MKATKAALKVLGVTLGKDMPGVQGFAVMEIVKSANVAPDPAGFVKARLTAVDPSGRLFSPADIDHLSAAAGQYAAVQADIASRKPKTPTDADKARLTGELDEAKRRLARQCEAVFAGCSVDSMESEYRALARTLGNDLTHDEAPKPAPAPDPALDGGRRTLAPGQNSGQRGFGNAGRAGRVLEPADVAKTAGWDERERGLVTYSMHEHAVRTAKEKGFPLVNVIEAAERPGHTYPNGRYPGQMRHIKGDICVIVDTEARTIVTLYANTTRTAPRADQTDPDARRYAKEYNRK